MKGSKSSVQPELNPRKKKLFTLIVILIPVLFFVLLESGLRVFNYGGNTKLFISGTDDISGYWMCNPEVAKRYFYMQQTIPTPSKDLFLKQKPANGYRIFVLGGSTTAGFPYGNNIMFSRILHRRLADAFPNKYIEVVNTAMAAINSYTLLDFMDETLKMQPDAILVYAGHNEYYGALGVSSMESLGKNPAFIRAYLKLTRCKTFIMVRNLVGYFSKKAGKNIYENANDPTATLMARIVADQKIPYKSDIYEKGKTQFRENLTNLLQKAAAAGVPVMLSDLVSNIRDQAPFESVKIDSFPTAQHAFTIAQALDKQKNYPDAKTAYLLAKDLDALRFRASEEFNTIIYETAAKFKTPVVPMQALFAEHSLDGLWGNNLFVEHLHPNVQGNFLLADGFFNTLQANQWISAEWDSSRIRPVSFYADNWGYTELDSVNAALSIHYLKGGWPFQPQGVPNRSLESFEMQTIIDTLAYRVLVNKSFSLQSAHLYLAEYYEIHDQLNKAFNEYRALIFTIPWEMLFYERAVKILLKENDFNRALALLLESHKYGSNAFTNKWTGQLLIARGMLHESVPFLEKALKDTPNDEQLKSNYDKVQQSLLQNKKDQAADSLETQKQEIQKSLSNKMDEINKIGYSAIMQKIVELLKAREYNSAFPLLQKALELEDTFFTRKWLGFVNLSRGNYQEAVKHLEIASQNKPDDFEVQYNLCHGYILTGNKTRAKETIKQLEKLRPDFNDPHNLRQLVDNM